VGFDRRDWLAPSLQASDKTWKGYCPAPEKRPACWNSQVCIEIGGTFEGELNQMRYIALIHKDSGSCYGLSFPDFPGCISAGDSLDEAVSNGVEALSGHVAMMEADGDEIPAPRTLEAIMADTSLSEDVVGAVLSAVPLVRDRGSSTRINVSLDLGLLEAIDNAAKNRKQTRSAFLASAARREILDQF
jgi:predicted RNase H-like HicB family nuclease